MNNRYVIPISGKHPENEEAILLYLYENPEGHHSTNSLASELEDHSRTHEEILADLKAHLSGGILGTPADEEILATAAKRQRKPEDVQIDIESLIAKSLVRGDRKGAPGYIWFADIQLTAKGEREAIQAKNRDKELEVIFSSAIEEGIAN